LLTKGSLRNAFAVPTNDLLAEGFGAMAVGEDSWKALPKISAAGTAVKFPTFGVKKTGSLAETLMSERAEESTLVSKGLALTERASHRADIPDLERERLKAFHLQNLEELRKTYYTRNKGHGILLKLI